MKKILKQITNFVQTLFFPSVCEGCGEVGSYLCDKCVKEKIQFVKVQKCHVCKKVIGKRQKTEGKKQEMGSKMQKSDKRVARSDSWMVHKDCKEKTYLDGVFVVARYTKFIEDYIGDIKYEFYFAMIDDLVKVINWGLRKELDCKYGGQYDSRYNSQCDGQYNGRFDRIVKNSIMTFVPLNPWRKRFRGFNQSELLAVKLSKSQNTKCVKLLKRVKNTKKQVGLKRGQRLKNLKEAFEINKKVVEELSASSFQPSAIIVDDVMTTGATLEECAKVLKKAGIKKVYGLVVARG
jgi:ComF family protein